METLTVLLALCEGNPPVTSRLPLQSPIARKFGVFYVHMNKRLNKQLSASDLGRYNV